MVQSRLIYVCPTFSSYVFFVGFFFFGQLSKDAITKETPKIPAPIAATKHVVTDPALKYVTLASFSWDQDDDKVKVLPY